MKSIEVGIFLLIAGIIGYGIGISSGTVWYGLLLLFLAGIGIGAYGVIRTEVWLTKKLVGYGESKLSILGHLFDKRKEEQK